MHRAAAAWACLLALAAASALAEDRRQVVCTITVNSADEREAFRRNLPADRYEFVELVEAGRPDWLASSCRRGVQCDVLLVSGHFAGTEFYSSRPETRETLKVDEIERVQCSGSCGLFSHLKEVYLFGCDSLKPEPVASAMPEIVRNLVREGTTESQAEDVARALSRREGEDSRDHIRRLFPDVPVIYGFSSLAPYGRVAGPLLERWFDAGGAAEVGSGEPSAALLKLFGPASMVAIPGLRDGDENADYRAESCRYHDERVTAARKLEWLRDEVAADMPHARMAFERLEKFLAGLSAEQRERPDFAVALREVASDAAARERFIALVRATADPALRTRMAAVARDIGWLDAAQHRAELARMIAEMLATRSLDFGEVDLICSLGDDPSLSEELRTFHVAMLGSPQAAQSAARACLGDAAARDRALRALASSDEHDVQAAQAFLRHRPIEDVGELRTVAARVAAMRASPAQVRALETLARQRVADAQILDELARLYSKARSPEIQQAIAEVFLRADLGAIDRAALAERLRRDRIRPAPGLVDTVLQRLAP